MKEIELSKGLVMLLTTESNLNNAQKLSDYLLKKKYAACINFIEIKSSFWWNGVIEKSVDEVQVIIKTTEKKLKLILPVIKKIHSYDNPEIISIPIQVSRQYKEWANYSLGIKDSP
ncbi:divalent-cation tolerance protein CutA [Prochlorococcus sp. MIT 1223]|uniref:divalent-cation tolerance protein CutA n=1 Tax=Prochlorococcus sp. MIT 1223 TaxID=3096217 RepID=UPI002A763E41|nr:divalent-cation tolerance protein CutA [Prochlorococcus sp. MIT 1223]